MRLIFIFVVAWILWSLCRMRDRRILVVIPSSGTAQASSPMTWNPFDEITGIKVDPSEPIYTASGDNCCKCR